MSPPRRALITLTSAHAELFEGGGHTTGVFIGEALHPYNVFRAAGFEVDIASENGTWTEDWLSLQPGFMSSEERRQYDDENSDFRREMDANVKAVDVVDKDVSIQSVQAHRIHTVAYWLRDEYGVFFASAGHAALIDYPHATQLKKIAAKVWQSGGIVSAVWVGAFTPVRTELWIIRWPSMQ
jgi:putative intracellular protease/amidase